MSDVNLAISCFSYYNPEIKKTFFLTNKTFIKKIPYKWKEELLFYHLLGNKKFVDMIGCIREEKVVAQETIEKSVYYMDTEKAFYVLE